MNQHSGSAVIDDERLNFIDTPAHPGVAALAAYWEKKRGGQAMPDRQSINPAEIVRLLPNIFICEVVEGGREFRFRIFGTALASIFRLEMTGKTLSDIGEDTNIITNVDGARRRWLSIANATFQKAAPVFAQGHLVNTVHRSLEWHSYAAPLTKGGNGIAQIFGGLFFIDNR
ncbi:MAG TPA: PAS domain-containing protein [Parvibaculum sp.]|jgi:hypothetical protein